MSTLNLQVGANADDGYTLYTPPSNNPGTPGSFSATTTSLSTGTTSSGAGYSVNTFYRFTGVSGLSGATIDSAYYKPYGYAVDDGTPQTLIAAHDQESPSAPTTKEEHDGAARTTAKVTWDDPNLSTSDFVSSPDIKTVIQELADSYDPSAILILWDDDLKTDSDNKTNACAHDEDSAKAAKLDIDYTPAGFPVIQSRSEQKEPDNTTTSTITAPSGIQDGDLLLICMATDGDMPASSITWPSGFTAIAELNSGTACSINVAYKVASSESGNYTVSWTASEQAIFEMYRISPVASGSEIQDPDESNTGSSSTATITPVASTDTNNSLVMVIMGTDDDDMTEDSGGDADYTTEDVDRSNTGNGTCAIGVQSKVIGTAGVPPQCDLTLTAEEEFAAVWFAVRSVAPAGGQPTQLRTQGVPTGSGYRARPGSWN